MSSVANSLDRNYESVLLIDDEQDTLGTAELLFPRFGIRVETLTDERIESRIRQGGLPSAAVVDLKMPVIDGVRAACMLIAARPDIAVVFLSGHLSTSHYRAKAELAGIRCARWMEKPIPPTEPQRSEFFRRLRTNLRESKFDTLANLWRADTRFMSSPDRQAFHAAYQQIIGMGSDALPLIAKEIRTKDERWFWALKCITGEDPVRESSRGRFDDMKADWLQWLKKAGL